MRKITLITAAMLLSAGAANAFIYANDNSLLWTGAIDNNWNIDGNWDNVQGTDLGVPGNGNTAYALIDSGTANITPSSAPTGPGDIYRAYIGGTSGGTLNVSADSSYGRFYTGWDNGATGYLNLTAGAMSMNSGNFELGHNGSSVATISGGTMNASQIKLANGATSTSSLTISGGVVDASSYIWMQAGTATMTVNGSSASITADRLLVDAGNGHTLNFGLDAGGVTPINVDGTTAGSYDSADLNDLAIVLDDLVGFGGVGTYDLIVSAENLTESGLTVTDTFDDAGLTTSWAIVSEGGNEILRATVIPEPATLSMIALVAFGAVVVRRRFLI